MLPATPNDGPAHVQRRKMEEDYLPVALERIYNLITHQNPQVALAAAKWIAEQVLGKATQPITGDTAMSDIALALASTLREVIQNGGTLPALQGEVLEIPISENNVRILGVKPEPEFDLDVAPSPRVSKEIVDNDFPG